MKKALTVWAIVLFAGSTLPGQPFLSGLEVPPGEPLEYRHLEKAYTEWADKAVLQHAKGWKWYARWLHELAARSGAKGTFSDQLPLFRAAEARARQRQDAIAARSPGWIPAGPSTYPNIALSYIIRGMGRINCITFHPDDANTFWVGVAQGGIWKTTNGGESWLPISENLPILRISDIAVNPENPDEMYASVGDYAYVGIGLALDNRKRHTHYGMGVYKTVDGGQHWSPTGLHFEQSGADGTLTRRVFVHPEDGQRLVAAGIYGIKTSSDGGQNWTTTYDDMIWDIERDPSAPNVLYASTAYIQTLNQGRAGIIRSTDYGQSWSPLPLGVPPTGAVQRIELAIAASNPDVVYAAACDLSGGFYGLFRSTNGGDSWQLRSDAPNVLHWSRGTSGGGQGTYDLALLVHPQDPERVYIGGINYWASEDGGLSWKMASYWVGSDTRSSIHADQHFLAYNALDGRFYACNDGGLSRTPAIVPGSVDSIFNFDAYTLPTVWEDIAGGMQITSFYRLGLSQSVPGELIAGAQDNSSWLKREGEWYNVVGGDGMEGLIHPTDPNIVYGSSQNGNIRKSFDGGFTFPEYVPRGITNDWSEERPGWTTPFMLAPGDPETAYVGFTNLYRYASGASNPEQLSAFPGPAVPISSFAVSPSSPGTFYLAHRIFHSFEMPSRMWRSRNGGQSWDNITAGLPDSLYFTYTAVDESEPDLAWVTVGGFSEGVKVFRTVDGGNTWENYSQGLPNIPVNCIVQDPSSDINTTYIGTDIGVYVRNDEMAGWELYSDNLPNVIVSELEILPSENKIYAATFGRGIWEGTTLDGLVGITEPTPAGLSLTLSPNPNKGAFQLQAEGLPAGAEFRVEIVDITGRRVMQRREAAAGTRFSRDYSLSLPYGMYFLRLIAGRQRAVVKFLVE